MQIDVFLQSDSKLSEICECFFPRLLQSIKVADFLKVESAIDRDFFSITTLCLKKLLLILMSDEQTAVKMIYLRNISYIKFAQNVDISTTFNIVAKNYWPTKGISTKNKK